MQIPAIQPRRPTKTSDTLEKTNDHVLYTNTYVTDPWFQILAGPVMDSVASAVVHAWSISDAFGNYT